MALSEIQYYQLGSTKLFMVKQDRVINTVLDTVNTYELMNSGIFASDFQSVIDNTFYSKALVPLILVIRDGDNTSYELINIESQMNPDMHYRIVRRNDITRQVTIDLLLADL